MTVLGSVAAVSLWIVGILVGYAIAAYVVMFNLPPADEVESWVADVAFAFTIPFILVVTWIATLRFQR